MRKRFPDHSESPISRFGLNLGIEVMNNHFSGKLNDMHCENYNVAFPLCEVYQDTFPVSPEIDDWPSTGGCPGTHIQTRMSERLF